MAVRAPRQTAGGKLPEESLTFSPNQPDFAAWIGGVVSPDFGLRPTVPSVTKTRLRRPNLAVSLWRGSSGKNRFGYAAYSEHRDHRARRSRQNDTGRLPAQAVRNIPRQPGHRDGGADHGLD